MKYKVPQQEAKEKKEYSRDAPSPKGKIKGREFEKKGVCVDKTEPKKLRQYDPMSQNQKRESRCCRSKKE